MADTFEVLIKGDNQFGAAAQNAARDLRGFQREAGQVRQGFNVLTQVVSRASDVLALFGVDVSKAERVLFTITSTLTTATQAVRVFSSASLAAAAPIAGIAAAAAGSALAVWQLTRRLEEADNALGRFLRRRAEFGVGARAGTPRAPSQIANELMSAEDAVAAAIWERARAEQEAAARNAVFLRNAEDTEKALRAMEAAQRRAAAEAKRHAEELARLAEAAAEARFQLEAQAIVDFITWQRQQWEEAARARTDAFLKESERLSEEERRLAQETAELVREVNLQALNAIVEAERERLEETRRVLDQIKRDEEDTAKLIEEANRQAIEAIEQAERERAEAARQLLEEQRRLAEEARRPWEDLRATLLSTFVDAIVEAREFGEVIRALAQDLIRLAARFIIMHFLNLAFPGLPPLSFAGGGVVHAQQGLVTQSAVPALLHPNEVVLPLPPGLRPEDLAKTLQGGGREMNLQLVIVDRREDAPLPPPGYIEAVVTASAARRGPVHRAIRQSAGR